MCSRRAAAGLILGLALAAAPVAADELDDAFADTRHVNEGTLRFLTVAPERPVHLHHNRVTLLGTSLDDGWTRLEQCHRHLDAVRLAQVLYARGRIRDLRILESLRIGTARVEGDTVQLRDVAPGATLCVQAETRNLVRDADGSFTLRSGPFMRRFLDGYYPMRVRIDVHFPAERLVFAGVDPAPTEGFAVLADGGHVRVDALFEGRLVTTLRFRPLY